VIASITNSISRRGYNALGFGSCTRRKIRDGFGRVMGQALNCRHSRVVGLTRLFCDRPTRVSGNFRCLDAELIHLLLQPLFALIQVVFVMAALDAEDWGPPQAEHTGAYKDSSDRRMPKQLPGKSCSDCKSRGWIRGGFTSSTKLLTLLCTASLA
jgi:hypothetical protein